MSLSSMRSFAYIRRLGTRLSARIKPHSKPIAAHFLWIPIATICSYQNHLQNSASNDLATPNGQSACQTRSRHPDRTRHLVWTSRQNKINTSSSLIRATKPTFHRVCVFANLRRTTYCTSFFYTTIFETENMLPTLRPKLSMGVKKSYLAQQRPILRF